MSILRSLTALVLPVRLFFAAIFNNLLKITGLPRIYRYLRTNSANSLLSKALSLVLIVSILTVSTPAAGAQPLGLGTFVNELGQDIRYSFLSNSSLSNIDALDLLPTGAANSSIFSYGFVVNPILAVVTGAKAIFKKKKQERPRVARLEITPNGATIRQGQRIAFAAAAFDAKGAAIQGVAVSFKAIDRAQKTPLLTLKNGLFEPLFSGEFVVTAEADGVSATTLVRVVKDTEAGLQTRRLQDATREASEAAGAAKRERGVLSKEMQELAAQPLPAPVNNSSRSLAPAKREALGRQRALPTEQREHPNTPFVPMPLGAIRQVTDEDVQKMRESQQQQMLRRQQLQQQVPNLPDPTRRGGPSASDEMADDTRITDEDKAALRRDHAKALTEEQARESADSDVKNNEKKVESEKDETAKSSFVQKDSFAGTENSPGSSSASMFGSTPNGFIDGANAGRYISGWSFDPDASSNSNMVHIYFDGPASSGFYAGYVRANVPRPDLNAYFGIAGNHGYEFDVPAYFQNGGWHTVYAYGIDETGDANFQLYNSGMWFNFSGSGNPNWNDGNSVTADDPGQQPGNPPNQGTDGAGSSNFSFSAPVISLAGRGDLGVNLSLNYNSLLWHRANGEMTYDIDRGSPAPGWSIGLGKMIDMGVANGGMLEDMDGTRHSYDGTTQGGVYTGYSTYYGHTTDGSMIDYTVVKTPAGISYAQVRLPNGTYIFYGAPHQGAIYPTSIEDRHGNRMTIAYRDNLGPNIDYLVDTQNRIIHFNYDDQNRLVSIDGPAQNGGQRVFARIHYKQINVNGSFSGLTPLMRNANPYVIDAIYYPDVNQGYWFGDNDSYSSYGMIAKVVEQRAMSWSGANNNDQGTVTAGMMNRQMTYNYPLSPSNLSAAPQYTSMTEDWMFRDAGVPTAVTTYNIQNNASPRTTTVTLPNGNQIKQSSSNNPGGWNDGLLEKVETFSPSNQLLSATINNWQLGEYGSPRIADLYTVDEKGQTKKQSFTYTGYFNQVASVQDFGYSNNLLRTKVNSYENASNYVGGFSNVNGQNVWTWGRHIFSLVKTEELFEANGTRVSRTDYNYDQANLVDAPNVVQYSQAYNPYTTETYQSGETCSQWEWIYVWSGDPYEQGYYDYQCVAYTPVISSVYDSATLARGNLTQTISYVYADVPSGGIVYDSTYDITGNSRTTTTNCCQQMSFNYTTNTQYLLPESHTKGSSDPNSSERMTEYASYDYNTGHTNSSMDFNGRTTNYYYDAIGRLVQTNYSTGAVKTNGFADNDQYPYVNERVLDAGGNTQSYSHTYTNGRGQVRFVMQHVFNNPSNFWDGANWNDQQITYDVMGRKASESVVFANATGNPNLWTTYQYDQLSRVTQVTAPDGSVSQTFYNELQKPSSAAATTGNTVRSRDAWGRERWARTDDWGRTVEVVEPDPNGNGSVFSGGDLLTTYFYTAKDELYQIIQGGQTRTFWYDGIGRLIRQKLAEKNGSLTYNGQFVGGNAGGWSDVFAYDSRSNLIQHIDARGVKTNYNYTVGGNPDPLNRLQNVSYDKTGADTTYNIQNASDISLSYMTAGDKTRVSQAQTWWTTETNSYDIEGRISDYTITLPSNQPLQTSYLYDSLSRLTEIRYPAQYGIAGSPRKVVNPSYDETSRLKELKVDNQIQMDQIQYNPMSQVTQLKTGAGSGNADVEQYQYEQQTGLLTKQKVFKQNTNQTLLELDYYYNRDNSNGTVNGKTGKLTHISDMTNRNRDRQYEYDALGRLRNAYGGAAAINVSGLTANWQQTYTYDRYGNRTNVQASGNTQAGTSAPIPLDGLPNQAHDQSSNRINGYTYDLEGNLIRGQDDSGTWFRYEYDAAGRLVNIYDDNNNNKMGNGYTSSRQRLVKNEAGVGLFWYVWGGDSVIAEYQSAGWGTPLSWAKSYIYAGSRLLSTFTSNGSGGETLEFHHSDRLGTRLVTNPTANGGAGSSFEQSTLPFGTALSAETTGTTNQRFTSYDRSNVAQLDYAVNRSYSPGQGRFTSVDPIAHVATLLVSPQSLNLYSYVQNNPINNTDPSGLFTSNKCVFNINLINQAGLSRADIRAMQSELKNIFADAGITLVFNSPALARSGLGSYNLHLVNAFPASIVQEIRAGARAQGKNYTEVGVYGFNSARQFGNGWINVANLAADGITVNGYSLGRDGGHETGHFLLGHKPTDDDTVAHPSDGGIMSFDVLKGISNATPQKQHRFTSSQIAQMKQCVKPKKPTTASTPSIGGGGGVDEVSGGNGRGYRDYDPFRSLQWALFEQWARGWGEPRIVDDFSGWGEPKLID